MLGAILVEKWKKNITFCSWRRIFFSNRARPAVRMQTRSGATNCVRDYRIWLLLCQIQLMSPAVCCLYTCIDGFRSVNYPDVVQTLHKMPEIHSVFLAILPIRILELPLTEVNRRRWIWRQRSVMLWLHKEDSWLSSSTCTKENCLQICRSGSVDGPCKRLQQALPYYWRKSFFRNKR